MGPGWKLRGTLEKELLLLLLLLGLGGGWRDTPV